jgi:hypothetical protein
MESILLFLVFLAHTRNDFDFQQIQLKNLAVGFPASVIEWGEVMLG